jgi:WD40 repeat protein
MSKELLTISQKQNIKQILNTSTKISPFASLLEHQSGVSTVSFKNSSSTLLSGSFDTKINHIDVEKQKVISKFDFHKDGVWTISQPENENCFYSSGTEKVVYKYDLKSNKVVGSIEYHDQTVYDLKVSCSNKYLLSCSKGKICVWDVKNLNKPIVNISNNENKFVYSGNFLSDENYVIYGLIDGGLKVFDIKNSCDVCEYNIEFYDFKSDVNFDNENSVS